MTRVQVTVTVSPTRPSLAELAFAALANGCSEAVYHFRMWRLERANRRLAERLATLALAKRADYENALWHAGDPRGLYGQYPPYITPQRLERL
ncbi:hypothetical protein BA059_14785 [Mycolicibacterium sp. (ex Dasyatis americana)]|nr:hypothetical protein BA059_14785 [Mycolicibacterium sp. (ex Dasyatis americana)]